jgi:hypothetical protein
VTTLDGWNVKPRAAIPGPVNTTADDVLLCPNCGDQWTHVDVVRVTAASRQLATITATGEDSQARLSTSNLWPVGSYDGRRHTISVELTCETCPTRSALEFKQHKGQTFVVWREIED